MGHGPSASGVRSFRQDCGAATVAAKGGSTHMSVYRVIDVIGTSTTSWEDAAMTAVKTAKGTLRDVRVAEVVKQDLDIGDNDDVTYRVKLQLSFKYEGGPA